MNELERTFASRATSLLGQINGSPRAVELVHSPHGRWPVPPTSATTSSSSSPNIPRSLNIAVLDSSFNPPTRAHLALACHGRFDARLLLLSVTNADKKLAPGDASLVQRLQMMRLLLKDMDEYPSSAHSNAISSNDTDAVVKDSTSDLSGFRSNAAIAIIDEPTFVGKSKALLSFLGGNSSLSTSYEPRLTFMQGVDTLERLIAPRYYRSESQMSDALHSFFAPPPAGDGSRVICARRPLENIEGYVEAGPGAVDAELLGRAAAYAPESAGREAVALVDLGSKAHTLSSSAVRKEGRNDMMTNRVAGFVEMEDLYRNV